MVKYHKPIAIVIFIFLSVLFYHTMIFRSAEGIHSWAQADRLSLAENFYTDGMNFFRPSTYFVGGNKMGYVGVECPVQSYFAAVMGKLFGKAIIPMALRLFTLFFTILACYILFCWAYEPFKNFWTALIAPVFFFTMPIGAYYGAGFLPDSFSLSLLIAAFYFLFRFINTSGFRFLVFSLLIGLLAVLVKMSTAVFFAGILVQAFFFILLSKMNRKYLLLFVFIGLSAFSLLVILAQYEYILYLDRISPSNLFLASPKPLDLSFPALPNAFRDTYNYHVNEYFSQIQKIFILVAAGVSLFALYFLHKRLKYYYLQLLLVLSGSTVAFITMGGQFYIHQYYVIAIIYPTFIFLTVLFVMILNQFSHRFISAGGLVLVVLFVVSGYNGFAKLCTHNDFRFWGQNIGPIVNKVGIKQNERIIIAGGAAPNEGLLFADRKGISIEIEQSYAGPHGTIYFMRTHYIKYLIINHQQHDTIQKIDPCFFNYLQELYSGKECFIYKYKGTKEDQTLTLQPATGDSSVLFRYATSFEYPKNCEPETPIRRTGMYSYIFERGNEYLPPMETSYEVIDKVKPTSFSANLWVKTDSFVAPLFLVFASMRNDTVLDYKSVDLSPQLKLQSDWQHVIVNDSYLKVRGNEDRYFVYLLKPNKAVYAIDDLTIDFK